MIVKAAIKVRMLKEDNKEIIIPCHRHYDAFLILKELGYKSGTDFQQIEQGFLDEHNNFYDRVTAHKHAWTHMQLPEEDRYNPRDLFSEDLW